MKTLFGIPIREVDSLPEGQINVEYEKPRYEDVTDHRDAFETKVVTPRDFGIAIVHPPYIANGSLHPNTRQFEAQRFLLSELMRICHHRRPRTCCMNVECRLRATVARHRRGRFTKAEQKDRLARAMYKIHWDHDRVTGGRG